MSEPARDKWRDADSGLAVAPSKSSEEDTREHARSTWNELAQRYAKLLRHLEPYGFDLLARVDPKVREHCLDLACGPGEPALSIARMVGPEGPVIGIDLSEEMVRIATKVANERRLRNVAFRVMDAERLELPDASQDLVTSRFGFQVFSHPERAAREAHRVLRPRGRIGVAIWSTAEKATALDVAVGPVREFAEPSEVGDHPNPFKLGASGEMVRVLDAAGFQDAKEERRTHLLRFEGEDDYVHGFLEGTQLARTIREQEPLSQQKILKRIRENLRNWRTARGIEIPCEGVIVTASR